MNTVEQCAVCGAEKRDGVKTITVDYKSGVVVIRNVPATMCSQCGDEWINDSVAERIEHFVADAKNEKKQLEVIDFELSLVA